MGSAYHDHLHDRTLMGIDDAMARIAAHAEAWELDETETSILTARARSFEWVPPRGAMGEVALGLTEDLEAVVVTGGRGVYEVPEGVRIATRIDLFWAEPKPLVLEGGQVRCPPGSTLFAIDYKTGKDVYVDPIERNLQAIAGAVMAALWTGAQAAVPGIIFPGKGQGTWDMPERPLSLDELLEAGRRLLAVVDRVRVQRDRLEARRPLSMVEGPWCTYCASETFCAAKVGSLRALLDEADDPVVPAALTAEQLRRIATLQPQVGRLEAKMKAALKAHTAARGPIDLGDGTVWGPYEHREKQVLPHVGLPALARVVGEERARKALKISMSRDSMKDQVKDLHEATGVTRQVEPTMRSIMAEVIKAEGLKEVVETWWGRNRPEKPPGSPPALTVAARQLPQEIDGDPE